MFKKLAIIFIILLAFVAVFYMFMNGKGQEPADGTQDDTEPPKIDERDDIDAVSLINQIFLQSEKGMLLDLPFIAGETTTEEVIQEIGQPKQIDYTEVGEFALYSDHHVTIGYKESIAFDLRSYDSDLKKIHYLDILEFLGEADEIKYYQDNENDQIILIYQVSERYQLKWILEKPTDDKPNPVIHHISVVSLTIPDSNEDEPQTIADQVNNMSIEEKIGQMIFAGVTGTKPNAEAEQLVAIYKVGGIIINGKNITSPAQTVAYVNYLKKENRSNRIPLFFGIDQEGGRIAKLPGNLKSIPTNQEIGDVNNPSLSFEIGTLLGKLVDAYGFNMNFAPVLDVNSNPDNPVIGDRSFGNEPDKVAKLGVETMKGLQSEDIISVIKHFPGHGDTSVDSHLELPTVNKTKAELEGLELVPFKKAIAEGADVVMIAHIFLPKLDSEYPSSMSKVIITELLRNELGYDGVVITDDMTMKAVTDHYDIGKAAVASVKAGSDIIMVAHDHDKIVAVISALKSAVQSGEITEDRLNESVVGILELKEKYGLGDSSRGEVNTDKLNRLIDSVLDKYMNGSR